MLGLEIFKLNSLRKLWSHLFYNEIFFKNFRILTKCSAKFFNGALYTPVNHAP